jgi:TetR/AcrR family transcriptional regulator
MSTAPRRKPIAPRRGPSASAPAPERILSAALAAFAERGFDGATTREIAADAGVPQGLVTYHYASKQALWEAAVDWVFGELARELGAAAEALRDVSPVERWRAVTKRFVRFTARHPELHRLMTHEGAHDGPRLRWLVDRHVRPLYDASVANIRAVAPGVDVAHLHYVLIGAAAHLFAVAPEVERVTGRNPRTPERVEAHASAIVDWLIDGVLAQQAASSVARAPAIRPRRKR